MTQSDNLNKISIIIPVYNRADLIKETLDSILKQTYTNWECIIVDDGSTDNITDILIPYLKDTRFQFHYRPAEKKKGANSCRNYGLKFCTGEFVKWFDSDDIMLPDFLYRQFMYLDNDERLDFCVCLSETFIEGKNVSFINKANRMPSGEIISSYLYKNHYFLTAAPLWRKEFLKSNNLFFDEGLSNSDESDFHFRVLILKPIYYYSDDVLYRVRRGNKSITQDKANILPTLYSRAKFFKKVADEIDKIELKEKKEIYIYLLSRQLNLFYEIKQLTNRDIVTYFHNFRQFYFLSNKIRMPFFDKIKIFLGLLLVVFFRKGYSLMYFKVDCRESIEN